MKFTVKVLAREAPIWIFPGKCVKGTFKLVLPLNKGNKVSPI